VLAVGAPVGTVGITCRLGTPGVTWADLARWVAAFVEQHFPAQTASPDLREDHAGLAFRVAIPKQDLPKLLESILPPSLRGATSRGPCPVGGYTTQGIAEGVMGDSRDLLNLAPGSESDGDPV